MGRMMNAGSGVRQENKRWLLIHGPRFLAVLLVISMIHVAASQNKMSSLDQGLIKIRPPRNAKTIGKTNTQTSRVCSSTECIDVANQIKSSMNLTVNPCDDFYEYACGRWPTNNPLPAGYSYLDQFRIIGLKTERYKKRKIQMGNIRVQGASNEVQQMPHDMYQSCMNVAAIDNLGDAPLREHITELGGWELSGNWDENTWDFNETLLSLHKVYNEGPVFKVAIVKGSKDKTIYVHQATRFLKKQDFLNLTSKRVLAYKQLFIDVVLLLGVTKSTADQKADEIISFEAQLANVTLSEREWRKFQSYTRTLGQLQQLVPEVNWTLHLNKLFEPSTITGNEQIVLPSIPYLKSAMKIIENTPKRILANYMVWRVIQSEIGWLSKPFRDALTRYNHATWGTTSERVRWKKCIDSTFQSFEDVITAAYVNENNAQLAEKISLAREIVNEDVQAFKDNVNPLTWLDDATKNEVYQKIDSLRFEVGFPSYMLNSTKMASIFEKYRNLNIKAATYFKNKVAIGKNNRQLILQDIRKPYDDALWDFMTPLTTNAGFYFVTSIITLPAAILQPPILFSNEFLRAYNIGKMGFIVAHEMMHAFGINGRRYDKDRKERNWWSNRALTEFHKRVKCFENQYSGYKIIGKVPINGQNTAEENVADNGALKIAFKVYKTWAKQYPSEKWLLPGLNNTNEQLFYIGLAQNFCGNSTLEVRFSNNDERTHTDDKFRVIGSLANSCEFANAFKCKKYSPMNPIKKCYLWSKEGPLD